MSILLFGATGMLGRYVLKFLEKDYKIISILRDEYDIEIDDWNKLEIIIKNNIKENDIIINCSGIILQKYDNYHLAKFIKVNTLFPHKLNELSNKLNLKFIHITTDCVYNGVSGNYNEDNIHNSDNIYGISKSLGEPENATIIRTSIIGEEMYHKKSLLEWILSNKNKEISGFKNHYWNGVTCLTLAKIIHEIIYKKLFWNGVRHIYTPDIISKYDLCKLINNIYNLNITILPLYNDNPKNLILSTKYDLLFNIDNIELQIKEQKEFRVKYGSFDILKKCRFCNNNNLNEIMKFNDFPLSGCFLKNKKNIIYERSYPLTLLYCDICKTSLIKEIIKEDYLFKNINEDGYFYYSSTILSLVNHFKILSDNIIKNYPDKKKILEIGCNDGVFIKNFIGKNYQIIGIDPSQTINNIISDEIIKYNNFFNYETSNDILNKYGKQDIIVCCNCLAHINDINSIYSNIKKILDIDGTLIIEVHYIKNIIDEYNFDFIYHEHMSYYSINTIVKICEINDLYLDNIEFIELHGGSLRAFIKNKSEKNINFYNYKIDEYLIIEDNFKENINLLFYNLSIWKNNIDIEIQKVRDSNNKIVGYGASGRTNMIINYINVNFDIILDDSLNKINCYMPYYHNKISDSIEIYNIENNINIIFILAWPYTKSIINKHIKFIINGGIFIKILPKIEIININNYINFI